MTIPSLSLRMRLMVSHMAVVVVGVVTTLIVGNLLAPTFIDRHVRAMGRIAGTMMEQSVLADFERGALSGFGQALLVAAAASTIAALVVAAFASGRLLRPLEPIRRATRRLAGGSYAERVPIPREPELAGFARDVNALAAALQETEERRLRLIAEVTHELRTPLATIKGYMEGLVDGVFPATDEVFATVGREAERLERLATDLTELSLSEEGRRDLRLEVLDPVAVATEVAERLRPQFDDQEVTLSVRVEPGLRVRADRDRLAQVFTNIIGNALTYTPTGGHVEIEGESHGGYARVSVTDTGRGLNADQIDAVFERFYRSDRSAPGGTGIGLTIARSIARQHGGDIEASSPGPGDGSTFTVVIPAARGGAGVSREPSPGAPH